MIISQLTGGLGNQMFQYAAGLALAEKHHTVLKLDVSWFRQSPDFEAHNRYALSCFNITNQFATAEEIDRLRGPRLTRTDRGVRKLLRAARLDRFVPRYAPRGTTHYAEWRHFDERCQALPDQTYLSGHCQSERYFSNIEELVRSHFSFRYPATPEVAALEAEITASESIAVHFRRGDYVSDPGAARDLGALRAGYYDRACATMLKHCPRGKFYVFSDDITTVRREFTPQGPHVYVPRTGSWHDHDALRLISRCRHAIIANSTFSWWGAWLIPQPNKIVIAPSPWWANPANTQRDVVPAGWLELPRDG